MNTFFIITSFLIVSPAHHAFHYRRALVIPAIRSIMDIISVCIRITTVLFTVLFFARTFLHVLMLLFGILLLMMDITKQGFSNEGLLIIAGGKELYRRPEIHHIEITITSRIQIAYHAETDACIAAQNYSLIHLNRIMSMVEIYGISANTAAG